MKVAVSSGNGDISLAEAPLPAPGPYECLCKVLACATCSGTDMKIISGQLPWDEKYPAIVGHESVGVVVERGKKARYVREGQRYLRPAAVYPGGKLGGYFSIWGGFAEYGLITDVRAMREDNLNFDEGYRQFQMPLPDMPEMSPADAIMLITLKETAGYVFDIGIGLNDSVVVLGAGPVAMSMSFFAKIRGAYPLICIARRDEPLEYIRRFGVNHVINNSREDAIKRVMDITGGRGARYIIETTGDKKLLLASAPKMLLENGGVALYAVYDQDIKGGRLPFKLVEASPGETATHDYMLDLARVGLLPLNKFYSQVMPFSEIKEGFDLIRLKKAFKVVFQMEAYENSGGCIQRGGEV